MALGFGKALTQTLPLWVAIATRKSSITIFVPDIGPLMRSCNCSPLLSKAAQHTRPNLSFTRRSKAAFGTTPSKPAMPAAAPREVATAQEANELVTKQGYKCEQFH